MYPIAPGFREDTTASQYDTTNVHTEGAIPNTFRAVLAKMALSRYDQTTKEYKNVTESLIGFLSKNDRPKSASDSQKWEDDRRTSAATGQEFEDIQKCLRGKPGLNPSEEKMFDQIITHHRPSKKVVKAIGKFIDEFLNSQPSSRSIYGRTLDINKTWHMARLRAATESLLRQSIFVEWQSDVPISDVIHDLEWVKRTLNDPEVVLTVNCIKAYVRNVMTHSLMENASVDASRMLNSTAWTQNPRIGKKSFATKEQIKRYLRQIAEGNFKEAAYIPNESVLGIIRSTAAPAIYRNNYYRRFVESIERLNTSLAEAQTEEAENLSLEQHNRDSIRAAYN